MDVEQGANAHTEDSKMGTPRRLESQKNRNQFFDEEGPYQGEAVPNAQKENFSFHDLIMQSMKICGAMKDEMARQFSQNMGLETRGRTDDTETILGGLRHGATNLINCDSGKVERRISPKS